VAAHLDWRDRSTAAPSRGSWARLYLRVFFALDFAGGVGLEGARATFGVFDALLIVDGFAELRRFEFDGFANGCSRCAACVLAANEQIKHWLMSWRSAGQYSRPKRMICR